MIEALKQPCWRIVTPDGSDWSGDWTGNRHFDTEQDARRYLAEYLLDSNLYAAPFDVPCVVVTCDGGNPESCRAEPDDDEFDSIHFPSEDDARKALDVYDFRAEPAPGTAAWCEDCQGWPHAHLGPALLDCWRCGEPADEHPEVDPPNRLRGHCDGQISLDGAA